jgi:hypothetical protein
MKSPYVPLLMELEGVKIVLHKRTGYWQMASLV